MNLIRSRLLVLSLALVVCQAGLATAAPFAAGRVDAGSVAEATVLCTCPHPTDGAECPMHRGQRQAHDPRGKPGGARVRAGCGDQAAAILTALSGVIGIVQSSPSMVRPSMTGSMLPPVNVAAPDIDRPPPLHPPRS